MSHHGKVHHIKGISQQTKHPLRAVKSFMLYLFSILLHLLNCVCVFVSQKRKRKRKKEWVIVPHCSRVCVMLCIV